MIQPHDAHSSQCLPVYKQGYLTSQRHRFSKSQILSPHTCHASGGAVSLLVPWNALERGFQGNVAVLQGIIQFFQSEKSLQMFRKKPNKEGNKPGHAKDHKQHGGFCQFSSGKEALTTLCCTRLTFTHFMGVGTAENMYLQGCIHTTLLHTDY